LVMLQDRIPPSSLSPVGIQDLQAGRLRWKTRLGIVFPCVA
jgi:hypothetical protein